MMIASKCRSAGMEVSSGECGPPVPTAEDAALRVVVVELRAHHPSNSANGQVQLGGGEHAQERRGEVDPERRPDVSVYRRAHGSGGIHAHSGEGRLEDDKTRDEHARAQPSKAIEARVVGDGEDHGHQHERDEALREERLPNAALAWDGSGVVHVRLREPRTQKNCCNTNTDDRARKLSGHVKDHVPWPDLAQAPEGERDRWVEMSARPLPPTGVDDS